MGNKPSAKNKYQAGRADTGATIAETAAAATRTPTTTVCVYIVRHAQRADEVSVEEFRDRAQELDMRGIRPQKWYDPPLTNRGVQQASACAAQLATLQASGVLFSRVYSSPFQRTMQTAQEIAAALKLDICPSHALGSCAAAVKRKGLAHFVKKDGFLSDECLQQLCPNVRVLPQDAECIGFRGKCEALARACGQAGLKGDLAQNVLVVTHREGIYDLLAADPAGCGERWRWGTPPYCCVVKCSFVVRQRPQSDASGYHDDDGDDDYGGDVATCGVDDLDDHLSQKNAYASGAPREWSLSDFDLFKAGQSSAKR